MLLTVEMSSSRSARSSSLRLGGGRYAPALLPYVKTIRGRVAPGGVLLKWILMQDLMEQLTYMGKFFGCWGKEVELMLGSSARYVEEVELLNIDSALLMVI